MMDIYFACSITGGRQAEEAFQVIVRTLEEAGHSVPTAHLSQPDVLALELMVEPGEVYQRDIEWIANSQALVAEVTSPSHGVGYEIAFALSIGKPVLCCYREGTPVSKMITGNNHPCLRVRSYQRLGQLQAILTEFLGEVNRRENPITDEVNNITDNM
jgi:hypothetical protein